MIPTTRPYNCRKKPLHERGFSCLRSFCSSENDFFAVVIAKSKDFLFASCILKTGIKMITHQYRTDGGCKTMAKHNYVALYGQVADNPTIYKNEAGEYKRGICPVVIIRGVRNFGNSFDRIKYDMPRIMTGNPALIAQMETWKHGDMVEIKGAITTKDVIKSTTCKHCGAKNRRKGNVVFVNPIYLNTRETDISKEDALTLLKERCEISNQVTIIGTLCREPAGYITERGLSITTYQLAVNRKYRIRDDATEARTDFPWVKSYGVIADNDVKFIRRGTRIFVDGMIQTRNIERIQVCESCGESYNWNDTALEIVPYATEYLANYNSIEEIAAMEAEEQKKARQSVLGEGDIEFPDDEPNLDGISHYDN